jgi:hypothetical protein
MELTVSLTPATIACDIHHTSARQGVEAPSRLPGTIFSAATDQYSSSNALLKGQMGQEHLCGYAAATGGDYARIRRTKEMIETLKMRMRAEKYIERDTQQPKGIGFGRCLAPGRGWIPEKPNGRVGTVTRTSISSVTPTWRLLFDLTFLQCKAISQINTRLRHEATRETIARYSIE